MGSEGIRLVIQLPARAPTFCRNFSSILVVTFIGGNARERSRRDGATHVLATRRHEGSPGPMGESLAAGAACGSVPASFSFACPLAQPRDGSEPCAGAARGSVPASLSFACPRVPMCRFGISRAPWRCRCSVQTLTLARTRMCRLGISRAL